MSRFSHGAPGTVYIEQDYVTVETGTSTAGGLYLYTDREYTDGKFRSVMVHLNEEEARALRRALSEFIGDDE